MAKSEKKATAVADVFRNRIVGHGEEAPEQLLANPRNFRRHPGSQREALKGSLDELGWVKTVLVNQRSGFVLDGHARIEAALAAGAATVPVTYCDLTEAEERLALAVLDPISEMATRDDATLTALLEEIETGNGALADLLDAMRPAEVETEEDGDGVVFDQAIQLRPGREFVIVVAEAGEEWDDLRAALDLPMVRRGGYKAGSAFDAVAVQRVIRAADLLARIGE